MISQFSCKQTRFQLCSLCTGRDVLAPDQLWRSGIGPWISVSTSRPSIVWENRSHWLILSEEFIHPIMNGQPLNDTLSPFSTPEVILHIHDSTKTFLFLLPGQQQPTVHRGCLSVYLEGCTFLLVSTFSLLIRVVEKLLEGDSEAILIASFWSQQESFAPLLKRSREA